MKVVFTPSQLEYAKKLAAKRHEAKGAKIKNTSILTNTAKKTKVESFIEDPNQKPHFLGLLGEMAYAIVSGKTVDETIYEVRDSGYDVGDAEIKTSTWKGDSIELKIKQKEFDTKFPKKYVLVRVDEDNFNTVEVVGEITREDFNKHKREKQYAPYNPMNYVVGIEHLTLFK